MMAIKLPKEAVAIKPDDLVKVRVTLRRADFPLWPKIRKEIQKAAQEGGWQLYGPELRAAKENAPSAASAPAKRAGSEELVRRFASAAGADSEIADIGIEIVKSAQP